MSGCVSLCERVRWRYTAHGVDASAVAPAAALLLKHVLPYRLSECALQEGMLPLHFAAWFNRLDVAALLMDNGSAINPPTKVTCRPLFGYAQPALSLPAAQAALKPPVIKTSLSRYTLP